MRVLVLAAALTLAAAPAFAQQVERGYISGAGGFTSAPDGTSGDVVGEVGVRVARNVFVIGNVGQFSNLQPSLLQPSIDATTQNLSDTGLVVNGSATVPAWYTTGGLRVQIPTRGRVVPYVFSTIGMARLR